MLKPSDGTSFWIGSQSSHRVVVGNKAKKRKFVAKVKLCHDNDDDNDDENDDDKIGQIHFVNARAQLLSIQHSSPFFFSFYHFIRIFESFLFRLRSTFLNKKKKRTKFISQPAVEWILSIFYGTILFFCRPAINSISFNQKNIELFIFQKQVAEILLHNK